MSIIYHNNRQITAEEFVDILQRSTLALRRPVDDPERIDRMLTHANVMVTAWHGELLVGISRAITDFSFCCYLSDLAVDVAFQHRGIGKRLIEETHKTVGGETKLILLAAPAAVDYYPKIGMQNFPHCFVR